jgi:hypothetical protein
MHSYRQIFLYDASTSGTLLSGVLWIYFYQLSTSTLSLVRKHEYELRPGCIMNASIHTIIMAFLFQTFEVKILNTDDIKVIDTNPRELMQEIISLAVDSFMQLGDFIPKGFIIVRFPRGPCKLSLQLCHFICNLFCKSRIF